MWFLSLRRNRGSMRPSSFSQKEILYLQPRRVISGTRKLLFPKSLYAVEDTIFPFVRMKKDALILDFFSGSGTTFHATALMNARDGGRRRCISITNNEVSEERHKELTINGLFAGDEAYEMDGIANAAAQDGARH